MGSMLLHWACLASPIPLSLFHSPLAIFPSLFLFLISLLLSLQSFAALLLSAINPLGPTSFILQPLASLPANPLLHPTNIYPPRQPSGLGRAMGAAEAAP
eukprot:1159369-Pelagomonas_calceolata.AAC.2